MKHCFYHLSLALQLHLLFNHSYFTTISCVNNPSNISHHTADNKTHSES